MDRKSADGITWYEFGALAGDLRLRHGVFTRQGGISKAPFAALNLGRSVGDTVAAVEENHRRALAALGLERRQTVSCYQVHGARVGLVGTGHLGTVQPATDALVTADPGTWLLMRFADCVPVLLVDPGVPAVGMAHAGWRGVACGVLGATVAAMVQRLGCAPARMAAGIGPAIGACCYEVGAHTVEAVASACPAGTVLSADRDRRLVLDLPAAVRAQLEAAGVGVIESAHLCTACNVGEFFSHRAEKGKTGRFGAVLGLLP
jgi:polyphenol oxidase